MMGTNKNFSDHWWMGEALGLANIAYASSEVPVGAILIDGNENVLSRQYNLKEQSGNPCSHAEVLCLTEAGSKRKNWRLSDCTLYVTLEPCVMCAGALINARIKRLVFGAYDAKGGAYSLGYSLFKDKRLNHSHQVMGGFQQFDCSQLLSKFFKERRKQYQSLDS
jgi:tRNA(adenine34) deaminase